MLADSLLLYLWVVWGSSVALYYHASRKNTRTLRLCVAAHLLLLLPYPLVFLVIMLARMMTA